MQKERDNKNALQKINNLCLKIKIIKIDRMVEAKI
jgi:hypothetical protein